MEVTPLSLARTAADRVVAWMDGPPSTDPVPASDFDVVCMARAIIESEAAREKAVRDSADLALMLRAVLTNCGAARICLRGMLCAPVADSGDLPTLTDDMRKRLQ